MSWKRLLSFTMQEFEKKARKKKAEVYGKSTRMGTITTGIAGNLTSNVNLHVEFFWQRAQFDFGIIKPGLARF